MRYSKDIKQEVLVRYVCGYTPKEIAEETGIHFVTIYRWINSWRKDLDNRPLTDLPLQDVGTILTCTEELKRKLEEAERIRILLHNQGVIVSKKKIIRFMKQLELNSNICSDAYYPSQSQEEERDNVQILQ